jgi:serine/threonine protein kinase
MPEYYGWMGEEYHKYLRADVGGQGYVWLAEWSAEVGLDLPNPVAIKETTSKLAITEVATLKKLRGIPGVPQYFADGAISNPSSVRSTSSTLFKDIIVHRARGVPIPLNKDILNHFIVMEFCNGDTLEKLVSSQGEQDCDTVRSWASQTATTLDQIHDRELVHGNVRSKNLILDDRIMLVDYVTAFPGGEVNSKDLSYRGHFNYVSPEAFTGVYITPSADVYSLGCSIFEWYTGVKPYRGRNSAHVVEKQLYASLPDPSRYRSGIHDTKIESLIRSMMEKTPKNRATLSDVISEYDTE